MASILTRKRGRPFGSRFTPEERKARKKEYQRLFGKESVHIGDHITRWNRLKVALCLMYNHEVAGYLLDRYENDKYTQKLVKKNRICHRDKTASAHNTSSTLADSQLSQNEQTAVHEGSEKQHGKFSKSKVDDPSLDPEEISNGISLQLEVDDGVESIDDDESVDEDSSSEDEELMMEQIDDGAESIDAVIYVSTSLTVNLFLKVDDGAESIDAVIYVTSLSLTVNLFLTVDDGVESIDDDESVDEDSSSEDEEEMGIKQEQDSEDYTTQNSGSTPQSESSTIQTKTSKSVESGGDNPSHMITEVKQEPVDNYCDSLDSVLPSDTREINREELEMIKTELGSAPENNSSGPRTSSAKPTPAVHPSVLAQNVPQNTVLFAHRIIKTVIPMANVASSEIPLSVNTNTGGNMISFPLKTSIAGNSLYLQNNSLPQTLLVNPQNATLVHPLGLNLQGSSQIPGSIPRAANFTVLPNLVQRGFISSKPFIVTGGQQVTAGRQQTLAGAQQPNTREQQPNTGAQQPNTGAQQPNMGAWQPNRGTQQPTIGALQLNIGVQQPNIGAQQSTIGAQQPVGLQQSVEESKLKRALSEKDDRARTRKRFASVAGKETQEEDQSKTIHSNDTSDDCLDVDEDDIQSEADDFDENHSRSSEGSEIGEDTEKPSKPATGKSNIFPRQKKKRFKKSTDEEISRLFEARQTAGTRKNTTWGCKMIQDWSKERRGEEIDFETVSPTQLNKLLEKFYCEARPEKDGQVYHKNTLKNLRAAINRRLGDLKRSVDIVKDKEFRSSNGVLAGLLKERAREGIGVSTQHKEIIEKSDLEKISAYFKHALLNPIILRQCVYFHLTVHFICRAHEFRKDLKIDSFTFHIDDNGEYVNHEIRLKGVRNAEITMDKRMYATHEDTCPVKMLKLLIDKTDDCASALFNNYRKDAMFLPRSTSKWYKDAPLTQRTITDFMKDISKAADLSRIYTGQCLRATAIQHLTDEGFEGEDIVYMTGYKNGKSLKSNNKKISASQKRNLSCSLSKMINPLNK
ncbi:uncharacterized protein LOC133199206 [Saccostrea echinata]|uniref:uncharacterized protein LOC133199206 n=1 Tax=Saccostrea echinata TaxID=191078 RepID=UPI002A7F6A7F|nr:uncharacterized protein LOC133199206 [Saccostrea echinata]